MCDDTPIPNVCGVSRGCRKGEEDRLSSVSIWCSWGSSGSPGRLRRGNGERSKPPCRSGEGSHLWIDAVAQPVGHGGTRSSLTLFICRQHSPVVQHLHIDPFHCSKRSRKRPTLSPQRPLLDNNAWWTLGSEFEIKHFASVCLSGNKVTGRYYGRIFFFFFF